MNAERHVWRMCVNNGFRATFVTAVLACASISAMADTEGKPVEQIARHLPYLTKPCIAELTEFAQALVEGEGRRAARSILARSPQSDDEKAQKHEQVIQQICRELAHNLRPCYAVDYVGYHALTRSYGYIFFGFSSAEGIAYVGVMYESRGEDRVTYSRLLIQDDIEELNKLQVTMRLPEHFIPVWRKRLSSVE